MQAPRLIMAKRLLLSVFLTAALLLLSGQQCSSPSPAGPNTPGIGQPRPGNAPAVLTSILGEYDVTFSGRVGGPYEPTNSIVSGTTTGIVNFTSSGYVSISPSKPGVIAVSNGQTIPGVNPQDVIFGAAVMQNPVAVSMGTIRASEPGDFSIFSMMEFALPSGSNQLLYTGCSGTGGPFSCVPMFYRRTTYSGDSVNLIYFVNQVGSDGQSYSVSGQLMDRHTAEAAAANLFSVPITSPILGTFNELFVFDTTTSFQLTITGQTITGQVTGAGRSVTGSVPQTAILEVSIQGTRRP
jgi:hypothetical protein